MDAELAPLKAAKRDESLRRLDDEFGAESRALKQQLEDLRAQVQEQRRQLTDLDQKVCDGMGLSRCSYSVAQ